MLILPLQSIREEDKKMVGSNLYHLARLSHLGMPVVESVVVVAPSNIFENAINRYLKNHPNIKDHLNNIKNELLTIPIPESLKNFELVNTLKLTVNIEKLWQNLLGKWTMEILSKIERGEKKFLVLTPQLIIFSDDFSAFGRGYFDEDKSHVVIKVEKGQLDFQISSEIENLILLGNKKLYLPQVYYWGIEGGQIKIVKVVPFTQSLEQEKNPSDKIVSFEEKAEKPVSKTATKIFLDYKGEVLPAETQDGVLLNITKIDQEAINGQLNKLLNLDSRIKIILYPDFDLSNEKILEFAKTFLFFRNKKMLDLQIVLPQTFSVDEFLNLKREYASLGIYSKGSLKIWKQFNTLADFLNLDEYLDGGFDGAIIDLDVICQIVCGLDSEMVLRESRIDWIVALEKFFKEYGFLKIIKNHKQVLINGKLSQNEELLNFFIRSGVWGIAFENGIAGNMREHIRFLEKQAVKKLSHVKI